MIAGELFVAVWYCDIGMIFLCYAPASMWNQRNDKQRKCVYKSVSIFF